MDQSGRTARWIAGALVAWCLAAPGAAPGAWFDNAWTFRRPVKVIWDDQRASGSELCQVEFFTAGKTRPDGADIRVATEDGRPLPFELLSVGPGDTARVVFSLVKAQRTYYVYFGNPDPSPPPANLRKVEFQAGLLMEVKLYSGAAAGNARQLKEAFEQGGDPLGRIMIDRPFIGYNPFGEEERIIARLSGSVFAPIDGKYTFAQATDDRGALFLDGKPLVYSELGPPDTRYNGSIDLKRGRHAFVFYHLNFAGPGWLTVGWKRPDSDKFDPILRESFGIVSRGIPGALEEFRKTLTADFDVEYLGEYFFDERYTHRYRFTAQVPKAPATYSWDFGDGQTAVGESVEHVYLADGTYPIRLTSRIGNNSDTQTSRMMVRRDYQRITDPPTDTAPQQSGIVADYDADKLPTAWLAPAVQLHLRAENLDAAERVVRRLARERKHPDADAAFAALDAYTEARLGKQQTDTALAPWSEIPKESDLQPRAAKALAEFLLWRRGDPRAAVAALRPFAERKEDDKLQRIFGQALVLDQQTEQGAAILRALKPQGDVQRRPALSGALARTIEFYLTEKDPEAGERQWERWQANYPADFLEGYGLLLRVRLMQLRKNPDAAARIAAAFAAAVPESPYAPHLLDAAWRLLEKSDPPKSAALRTLLKQRYPEDPLAQ